MSAWNGWYHVEVHTYGMWLRGDGRGWRSRHHREHVDGDYRHPPPKGMYDDLLRKSKELMHYSPVKLDLPQRELVGKAILEMLVGTMGIEVISLSMDAIHLHLLGKFATDEVRNPIGRAKKHAYFTLRKLGHTGPLWVDRCHVRPITDRKHQVNTYHYVLNHAKKGAWVWRFTDGLCWKTQGPGKLTV